MNKAICDTGINQVAAAVTLAGRAEGAGMRFSSPVEEVVETAVRVVPQEFVAIIEANAQLRGKEFEGVLREVLEFGVGALYAGGKKRLEEVE